MNKRRLWIYCSILAILFLFYCAASFFKGDFLASLLSPLIAITVFPIYFMVSRRSIRPKRKYVAYLIALAGLSWALVDIGFIFVNYAFQIVPETLDIYTYLYAIPNVMLFIATLIYLSTLKNVFNSIQLLVDFLAIGSVWLIAILITYFHYDVETLLHTNPVYLTTFLCALLDLVILMSIAIIVISVDIKTVNSSTKLIIIGVSTYAIIDFVYSYLFFKQLYFPFTLVDTIYIFAFVILALGGLLEYSYPSLDRIQVHPNSEDHKNLAKLTKTLIMIIAPALLVMSKTSHQNEVFLILVIIITYEVVTEFIQVYFKNSLALENQKKTNLFLEQQVTLRTAELFQKNLELETISRTDSITELYNRRFFMTELILMMNEVKGNETIVLFFIDLDKFKSINDVYGHLVGDKVLIEISKRMSLLKTKDSLIGRQGGDEFVLAFRGNYSIHDAGDLARKILHTCTAPIEVDSFLFKISMSIGITLYPKDALDSNTLLQNADIAMYRAKETGSNQFVFYNSILNEQIQRRTELEMLLKKADFADEFSLNYQPILTIDGKLTGIEALCRWKVPGKGWLSPTEFIPIAEENGVIVLLGEWIIDEASKQITEWNTRYQRELKMGINLSYKQLVSSMFLEKLTDRLKLNHTKSAWIDLEITESIAINFEIVNDMFSQIVEKGMTISIDDFGTGYSSLNYLKHLNIQRVKIAKPLIDNITSDYRDESILNAIITMTKIMEMGVIAEGVEDQIQLDLLKKLRCDEVQGYFFSKPLNSEEFEALYLDVEIT